MCSAQTHEVAHNLLIYHATYVHAMCMLKKIKKK